MSVKETEKIIGYEFQQPELLEQALIHSSYAYEHMGDPLRSNERLEFLGDSVLDMVVGEYLYSRYPEKPEGELTKIRASLVCEKSLGRIAMEKGLSDELKLGNGEEHTGGRKRASIAADMVESIIAAVYLDGGLENARKIIFTLLGDKLENAEDGVLLKDSKTELQEWLQKDGPVNLEYEIISAVGPDHAKEFTAVVTLDGKEIGRGIGPSKKKAEAAAAAEALEKAGEKVQ